MPVSYTHLGGWLGFLADQTRMAGAFALQQPGSGFVPQAVGALMFVFFTFPLGKIFVEPLSLVFTRSTGKDALQLPIGAVSYTHLDVYKRQVSSARMPWPWVAVRGLHEAGIALQSGFR